jgi:hypothetical protein
MAKFTVWRPENDETFEDGRQFDAVDSAHAAEEWADCEDCWGADYLIVGGRDTPIVHVRDEQGNETRYEVHGESVPSYTAYELPIKAAGQKEA